LVGILGGDPQLEGGCAWVTDDGAERWEVIWPEGYSVEFRAGPAVLTEADGEVVAETDDRVGVNGSEPRDLGSFCMVGRIFQSTEIVFVDQLSSD